VLVCAPNKTHPEIASHAVAEGKHVFCEKPFAIGLENAKKLLETAQSSDKVFQVGHNRRFAPVYARLKELVSNDTPHSAHIKMNRGELKNPVAMGDLKVFPAKDRTIIGLMFRVETIDDRNESRDKIRWQTFLLEYKGGNWRDATDELMPKVSVEEGYKFLTENLQIENIKKEDLRIEPQINPDKDTLLMVARRHGMENQTVKLFEWNGSKFVEVKD